MIRDEDCEELEHALRTCYELLVIADAQSAAIADGDIDLLNELLVRREELTASLHLENWALDRSATSEKHKGISVGPRPEKLIAKLQELSRVDEKNRQALEVQLAKIKTQIAKLDLGRQAIGRYAQLLPPPDALFIDRRR